MQYKNSNKWIASGYIIWSVQFSSHLPFNHKSHPDCGQLGAADSYGNQLRLNNVRLMIGF